MTDITMPKLSDSMQEGTILSWLKADGETIAAGEELVEIETDKATMTYEAPAAGTLAIAAAAGESLPVGAVIATVGTGAAVAPAPAPAAPAPAAPAPTSSPTARARPRLSANGRHRAQTWQNAGIKAGLS